MPHCKARRCALGLYILAQQISPQIELAPDSERGSTSWSEDGAKFGGSDHSVEYKQWFILHNRLWSSSRELFKACYASAEWEQSSRNECQAKYLKTMWNVALASCIQVELPSLLWDSNGLAQHLRWVPTEKFTVPSVPSRPGYGHQVCPAILPTGVKLVSLLAFANACYWHCPDWWNTSTLMLPSINFRQNEGDHLYTQPAGLS